VEYGFLTEAELSDSRTVGCLAGLAEGRYPLLVLFAKRAIVHNQKAWAEKQRVCRARPPWQSFQTDLPSTPVVCILQKLF
jgi:hypothetical protein